MQISELGEFALIERLTADLHPQNTSTVKAVGDDCAVLQYPETQILTTTDMLMEGIHFDLVYTPLRHLGYKSAMVNFSDIYAMNGTPRQLLVSVAVSSRFAVEDLDEFYAGLRLACQRHGVDLVGGDTSASLTGLAVSITVIGEAAAQNVVYRSGAHDTDLICCSGNLGAAYMGLQLMEREKGIYLSQIKQAKTEEARRAIDFQPDFSGREYLLERFLKPEARRDIAEALQTAGIRPTAMIDISDGLSSELLHLCRQSGVGCRVFEERIPLDYQTAVAAEEFNFNVSTCALNGGEDYELLFTVPLTDHDRVAALEDVKIIGHITRPELGARLVTRDGNEFELQAQGWNAAKHDNTDGDNRP
ncbi:thiamine-phosphate kinase [Alloprevotella sp. OH1205_COT-284]|uniref:thiamine-phosphate kinase n=1 Tax=Alloprevotella sp. OH1205_COT-284 TaxID=2491043 RepID=UPI000F5FA27C|nr:thiamine-phosphate kinase [Alloprevotella sp. OH1205_COT-284]RRD78237.1 thiamine-phosphate kinase [Alloprevotella sp. OH1205_COT-284]